MSNIDAPNQAHSPDYSATSLVNGSAPTNFGTEAKVPSDPYDISQEAQRANRFLLTMKKDWEIQPFGVTGRVALMEFGYTLKELDVPEAAYGAYRAKLEKHAAVVDYLKWAIEELEKAHCPCRWPLWCVVGKARRILQKTQNDMKLIKESGILTLIESAEFEMMSDDLDERLNSIPLRGATGQKKGKVDAQKTNPLGRVKKCLTKAIEVLVNADKHPAYNGLLTEVEKLHDQVSKREEMYRISQALKREKAPADKRDADQQRDKAVTKELPNFAREVV